MTDASHGFRLAYFCTILTYIWRPPDIINTLRYKCKKYIILNAGDHETSSIENSEGGRAFIQCAV